MPKFVLVLSFAALLFGVCAACMQHRGAFSNLSHPTQLNDEQASAEEPAELTKLIGSLPGGPPPLNAPRARVKTIPSNQSGWTLPGSGMTFPNGRVEPPVRVIPPVLEYPFTPGFKTMELPQPYDIRRDAVPVLRTGASAE